MLKILPVVFCCLAAAAGGAAEQVEGVPFFRQERHQCGPAALAGVLAYYGQPLDMARILQETYTESIRGSLMPDLENYARKLGFRTESGQGTLQTIQERISAGRPVILLIDNGVWLAARPHYILAVGFNEKGVIAHDGSHHSVLFGYEKFEKAWGKMGNPYLVIHP